MYERKANKIKKSGIRPPNLLKEKNNFALVLGSDKQRPGSEKRKMAQQF
jgi:hypothetical protein